MTLTQVLLLLIAVGLAFIAGYLMGRASATGPAPRSAQPEAGYDELPPVSEVSASPLPQPSPPPIRRAAPPPAAAGGSTSGSATPAPLNPNLRRTAKPPPAAAGLMGGDKPGK